MRSSLYLSLLVCVGCANCQIIGPVASARRMPCWQVPCACHSPSAPIEPALPPLAPPVPAPPAQLPLDQGGGPLPTFLPQALPAIPLGVKARRDEPPLATPVPGPKVRVVTVELKK